MGRLRATGATLLVLFTGCAAHDAASDVTPEPIADDAGAAESGGGAIARRHGGPLQPRNSPLTFRPTFADVYREIVVAKGCVLGLCHGEGGNAGGLNLQPQQVAYENLVGAGSVSRRCAGLGLLQVEAGAPEKSLFFLKLHADVPCGVSMPPGTPIESELRELVRRWIELGAANDG
jgi:hypothetical protein